MVELEGYRYEYVVRPDPLQHWTNYHPNFELAPYPYDRDEETGYEYGICCFCGDLCNAMSQACGRCVRGGGPHLLYYYDEESRTIYSTSPDSLRAAREANMIHIGPRGGRYRLIEGRKVYLVRRRRPRVRPHFY